MSFKTLLLVLFPEVDNFLTKDFVGAPHQKKRLVLPWNQHREQEEE